MVDAEHLHIFNVAGASRLQAEPSRDMVRIRSVIHQRIAEEGKVMKEIKLSFKSITEALNSATAVLLCLALISSAIPGSVRHSGRNRRHLQQQQTQRSQMINWTPWWRRSRYIQIRC